MIAPTTTHRGKVPRQRIYQRRPRNAPKDPPKSSPVDDRFLKGCLKPDKNPPGKPVPCAPPPDWTGAMQTRPSQLSSRHEPARIGPHGTRSRKPRSWPLVIHAIGSAPQGMGTQPQTADARLVQTVGDARGGAAIKSERQTLAVS